LLCIVATMADVVFLLGLLVGFLAIVWCFRTPAWWVPAAGSFTAGLVIVSSIPKSDGDVGGLGALGAGLQMLAGLGLFGVAVVCLVVGAIVRREIVKAAAVQAAKPQLPVATVVAGGSER